MGRQKHFDPEDVIDKAIDVFLTKGYEATAVKDIVAATNIHPGSLYNAFGNKRRLFELALDRFDVVSGFNRLLSEAETAPPRQTIEQIFSDLIHPETNPDGYDGCLITNAAAEFGGVDEVLSERLNQFFQKMEDRMCRLVERGQACGDFASSRNPRQLARLLLSAVQGMQLLSKVNPDKSMLEDTAVVALAVLDDAAS